MTQDRQQIDIVLTRHYHRMLSAGIAVNDCEESQKNPPDTWRDWHAQWSGRGDHYVQLAEAAVAAGHPRTAADHYTSAALNYHYAQFMLYTEPALKADARTKSAAAFRLAAPLLDPVRIPLEVTHEGLQVPAFLRLPAGTTGPVGVVTIIPGLEATKVEMSGWERYFLERGLATVVVDGPGQGELGDLVLDPRAYAAAISSVLSVLADRPDIDGTRLAIMGPSLGGLLTSTIAALDGRPAAVVEVGGTFDTLSRWGVANALSKAGHKSVTQTSSLEETEKVIATWSMKPLAGRVKAPFLIVHGEKDNVVPLEQSKMYHEAIPHSELVVVPNGNHVCNNIFHIVRPLIADWMVGKLAAVS